MTKDQELYNEFYIHLMKYKKPSDYFNSLENNEVFQKIFPFTLLSDLKTVNQSPIHHPEGNVWNHTMLVLDNAAQRIDESHNQHVFMWAALLHDIGKTSTTKVRKGKITSYNHDKIGAILAKDFLVEFSNDEEFIKGVSQMVRWHMQPLFVVNNLPFAELDKMLRSVPAEEIALLGLCDRLGRGSMKQEKIDQENKNIGIFLEKCTNI